MLRKTALGLFLKLNKKNPGRGFLVQVFLFNLVAGSGFEPLTFGL
jgi:hypothetical protein